MHFWKPPTPGDVMVAGCGRLSPPATGTGPSFDGLTQPTIDDEQAQKMRLFSQMAL